jgi:transcriptional regulator with XRE-family HTH domain
MVRGVLSRPEFGQKIGVSQSAVQNYETLNHIPKGDVLQRIHNEYGVDLNWLLTGKGEPYTPYSKGKQEGLPSAEGKGLWGQTRHHDVDGKQIDVTLFTPPSTQPSPDPRVLNPFVRGVGALQTIFDSGNPLLISAVQANLTAFEQAALQDRYLAEQSKKIQKLEEECEVLKKKIDTLEKSTNAGDAGAGTAKIGTDTIKQET